MDAANVISLVSAVVAIFVACLAFRSNHDEQRRRQREQASEVSGWVARHADAEWQARIRNRSALPVYNVRTVFHEMEKLPNPPNAGFGWRGAGPAVSSPRASTICVFPPETDVDVLVPEEFKSLYDSPTDRTCVVSISFTDAAGHCWERDEHGVLRQTSAPRKSGMPIWRRSAKAATG